MKPGDIAVLVVRGRLVPCVVIDVDGDTFRVRLGAAPRADHAPTFLTREQLDRRAQLLEEE
jgi:hypothetical protein